jgi:hypothetical protein
MLYSTTKYFDQSDVEETHMTPEQSAMLAAMEIVDGPSSKMNLEFDGAEGGHWWASRPLGPADKDCSGRGKNIPEAVEALLREESECDD